MNDTVPSEGSRIIACRDRLYDALGASNAAEGEVIRYITRALPIDAAEMLAAMAERALQRHLVNDQLGKLVAEAYDKGWTEAVAYCRTQQARGVRPVLWSDEPEGER